MLCMRVSSCVSEVDKFVNSFDGQMTERIYLIEYTLIIYYGGRKMMPNGALEIHVLREHEARSCIITCFSRAENFTEIWSE